jgi:hypothetical protein
MEYRNFGTSGIKISPISMGTVFRGTRTRLSVKQPSNGRSISGSILSIAPIRIRTANRKRWSERSSKDGHGISLW